MSCVLLCVTAKVCKSVFVTWQRVSLSRHPQVMTDRSCGQNLDLEVPSAEDQSEQPSWDQRVCSPRLWSLLWIHEVIKFGSFRGNLQNSDAVCNYQQIKLSEFKENSENTVAIPPYRLKQARHSMLNLHQPRLYIKIMHYKNHALIIQCRIHTWPAQHTGENTVFVLCAFVQWVINNKWLELNTNTCL